MHYNYALKNSFFDDSNLKNREALCIFTRLMKLGYGQKY